MDDIQLAVLSLPDGRVIAYLKAEIMPDRIGFDKMYYDYSIISKEEYDKLKAEQDVKTKNTKI
jgi:hypothetical protein